MRKYKLEIVYFHGFNSSPLTDKVAKLKAAFPDATIIAPNISSDPAQAWESIDNTLYGVHYRSPCAENVKTVLVGTSLGAFWASHFAKLWGYKCFLINPCYNPAEVLPQLGYKGSLSFPEFFWNKKHTYFISRNDEVVDFSLIDLTIRKGKLDNVHLYDHTDHRFNGPEFNDVIEEIRRYHEL